MQMRQIGNILHLMNKFIGPLGRVANELANGADSSSLAVEIGEITGGARARERESDSALMH